MKRTNITIDDESHAALTKLGDGNFSLGVRRAAVDEGLFGTCSACKYWEKCTTDMESNVGLGICRKAPMSFNSIDWDFGANGCDRTNVRFIDSCKNNLKFVRDGSDYKAELLTLSRFGCIEFEEKNDD